MEPLYMDDLDTDDDERYADELDPPSQAEQVQIDEQVRRPGGILGRTLRLSNILRRLPEDEIARRIATIIEQMEALDFDVANFMWYMSWSSQAVTRHPRIQYARTAFLHCDEFPHMLQKWRDGRRGAGTKAARDTLDSWSINNVELLMNREMRQLAPYLRSPQNELTEESLLSIKLTDLAAQIQTIAPISY
ncbi:hypothetical protein BC835DRAFT_1419054 [Cytidiella melzeri]|nr:hypothetical protein BC835DRAFT_1419054 [Cytidiella melzeri]